jgi:hypothetical protein
MIKRIAIFVSIGALVLVLVPVALAGKGTGGKGKPGGGGTVGGGTLTLVRLTPTADGLTHWSNWITWNVSTTATTEPFVSTVCKRGGVVIANTSAGYFASYPWPEAQSFSLQSQVWTGGAADCVGTLYSSSAKLATVSFHVYA